MTRATRATRLTACTRPTNSLLWVMATLRAWVTPTAGGPPPPGAWARAGTGAARGTASNASTAAEASRENTDGRGIGSSFVWRQGTGRGGASPPGGRTRPVLLAGYLGAPDRSVNVGGREGKEALLF